MTSFIMCIITLNHIFMQPKYFNLKYMPAWPRNVVFGMISTAGIAFEQSHKRLDITYFTLPKSIETFWMMLKNRKLVKDFPGMNFLAIAVALAMIAYKFNDEQE